MLVPKRGPKLRIAMLASGGGTTIKAVLEQCLPGGRLHDLVEPALIVASRPDAGALMRPNEVGIDVPVISIMPPSRRKPEAPTTEEFAAALIELFDGEEIDMFCQFGWLPMTPEAVLLRYFGINQHPGPVPLFGGKGMHGIRVHAARLNYLRKMAELPNGGTWPRQTVVVCQQVAPQFDEGAMIEFDTITIDEGETPESLQAKALPHEWEVQIRALERIARGPVNEMVCPFGAALPTGHPNQALLDAAKAEAIASYP